MRKEESSVDERRGGGGGGGMMQGTRSTVIKKRGCERTAARRRVRARPSSRALQRLFTVCRAVFHGPGTVPPPAGVDMLQRLLDRMKPEDVGLSSDLLLFEPSNAGKTPRITLTTIYSCQNFSMCLFFLPPNAVIPLHNHPGMTVFNKLLLGTMHIKSYDWVNPDDTDSPSPSAQTRLAKLVLDSDFTAPCNTSILYPTTGGNIHTFRAITSCLFLDVLGPPYSKEDDRDCTYYKDHPCSFSADGAITGAEPQENRFGWLEEIDIPSDLKMDVVEYLGPRIMGG